MDPPTTPASLNKRRGAGTSTHSKGQKRTKLGMDSTQRRLRFNGMSSSPRMSGALGSPAAFEGNDGRSVNGDNDNEDHNDNENDMFDSSAPDGVPVVIDGTEVDNIRAQFEIQRRRTSREDSITSFDPRDQISRERSSSQSSQLGEDREVGVEEARLFNGAFEGEEAYEEAIRQSVEPQAPPGTVS